MKFKSVTIKNFRNFEDISIELTNKNVFEYPQNTG